jgi:integrase
MKVSAGKITKRTWTWEGKRRTAYRFDVTVDGKRSKRQFATKQEAEDALDAFKAEARAPKAEAPVTISLGAAFEKYFPEQTKRTLAEDRRIAKHLLAEFGEDTPLPEITARRVSEFKGKLRGIEKSRRGGKLSAASINRPLSLLRHLLRIAYEEWELLPSVPKIKLEREPQGRLRWLEPDEEARLLASCAKSANPALLPIVTIALETGLRKSELLNLTWERVDMSRCVIRLETTKSGKRREVPMRQAVYNILAALPGEHTGRVWPPGDIRTAFENAVAAANVENFTLHCCRHHFASWFVMRGGNIVALQDILGHASLTMTRRYAHLAPDHLRGEMAKTEAGAPAVGRGPIAAQQPAALVAVGE